LVAIIAFSQEIVALPAARLMQVRHLSSKRPARRNRNVLRDRPVPLKDYPFTKVVRHAWFRSVAMLLQHDIEFA
jgi:hypothetical protein